MATVRGMLKSSIWGPSWSAGLEQMAFLASTGIGLGKQKQDIDLTSYIDRGGLLKVSVWSVQARQGTGSPAVSLLYEKGCVTEDPGERSNLWLDSWLCLHWASHPTSLYVSIFIYKMRVRYLPYWAVWTLNDLSLKYYSTIGSNQMPTSGVALGHSLNLFGLQFLKEGSWMSLSLRTFLFLK